MGTRRRSRPRATSRRPGPGWAVGVALVLGAVVTLRSTVIEPVRVGSESMSPTVCAGDVVLLGRLPATGAARVGDVVTFAGPTDGVERIKRIAALAGQTIAIADGVLVVDHRPVAEGYVDQASVDGVYFGPVTVPADSAFVLGDDREFSVDSRAFGPVPVSAMDGRLLTRVWSACPR